MLLAVIVKLSSGQISSELVLTFLEREIVPVLPRPIVLFTRHMLQFTDRPLFVFLCVSQLQLLCYCMLHRSIAGC
jgi:hypothetical protein